jgi:hypothetical protein
MTEKKQTFLHGEAMITQTDLPSGVSPVKLTEPYLIIAASEQVGNHHVVDRAEGVEFYELDGVRYMKNDNPARVRCLHEGRHDTIEVPPGTWEFGAQKEYDYLSEELRNVAD